MQFLYSIWKILHLTEYVYTGTAHGARNNYQVWVGKAFCLDVEEHSVLVRVGGVEALLHPALPTGLQPGHRG